MNNSIFNTLTTANLDYYPNFIWTIQISACLAYCLIKKRYIPNEKCINKQHFLIKQLYFYFITQIIIFLNELIQSNCIITNIEKFFHHLLAILLFFCTIYEPIFINVIYLLPTLIHSIYWCLTRSITPFFSLKLLAVYNLFLFFASFYFLKQWYCTNYVTLRVPLIGLILFNNNLIGYFYDFHINILNLDRFKLFISFIKSMCFTLPIYIFIIYFILRKKRKNIHIV
jgi:hypothetical protein